MLMCSQFSVKVCDALQFRTMHSAGSIFLSKLRYQRRLLLGAHSQGKKYEVMYHVYVFARENGYAAILMKRDQE